MTGTGRSSDGLDVRRRRALFHAWHRGMRETDLLLGTFADAYIADLSDAELSAFEALMEVPDGELLAWLTGHTPVAPEHATPLYAAIEAFHATRHEHS
jgi:antitoxin CptB